jgi:hypothetical protein
MQPLRRLNRHALGIKLPAFGERRSHLEAIRAGDRRHVAFSPNDLTDDLSAVPQAADDLFDGQIVPR